MKKNCFYSAFTLAEMMIVMLILSIIMAAFAPVVTTRSKSDRNSPWRYTSDNSNIYYGLGENQTAMIGQPNKVNGTDPSSRLIISTSDNTQKHITFKRGNDKLFGNLFIDDHSIALGDVTLSGSYNTALGQKIKFNNSGEYNVGLGYNLESKSNSGILIGHSSFIKEDNNNAIVIGSKIYNYGKNSIGIGRDFTLWSDESIIIGNKINWLESLVNIVAIGNEAEVTSSNSVAIGTKAKAKGFYWSDEGYKNKGGGVAIGGNAQALGDDERGAVAIGPGALARVGGVAIGPSGVMNSTDDTLHSVNAVSNSIALGYGANSNSSNSVTIGYRSVSDSYQTVAIGSNSSILHEVSKSANNSIAIGDNSSVTSASAVALGSEAKVSSYAGISIGSLAKSSGEMSIAIGFDAQAIGEDSVALGYSSLAQGQNNVALGAHACENVKGSNKVCIGANSGPPSNSDWAKESDNIERIFIGSQSTYTDPWGTTKTGPNIMEIFNNPPKNNQHWWGQGATVIINGNLVVRGNTWTGVAEEAEYNPQWGTLGRKKETNGPIKINNWYEPDYTSDARLKFVGKENISGLDKIRQLKVFNYTFKKDDKKTPHVGVIAQDLQKVFPDAVNKGDDGYLKIRMEDMFYALVNAVKELDAKVTVLIKQENTKDKRIKALEAKNKELEIRLQSLEKKL